MLSVAGWENAGKSYRSIIPDIMEEHMREIVLVFFVQHVKFP